MRLNEDFYKFYPCTLVKAVDILLVKWIMDMRNRPVKYCWWESVNPTSDMEFYLNETTYCLSNPAIFIYENHQMYNKGRKQISSFIDQS